MRQASREGISRFSQFEAPAVADSIDIARLDSLAHIRDSLKVVDSLFRVDSLSKLEKSSLKAPTFTHAGDSIIEVFSNGQKMVYYYGGVTAEYDGMKLSADYMEFDMNTGILYARGTLDTLTGEWTGQPVMSQGKEEYTMEELRYNFNTKKARITNMITHDDEGIIHGRNIKMLPDQSINITNGKYTVCDLEEPHYHLQLTAAKVMTKPTQKTVFGPAVPVIEGVTLPIGIPFGFVPKKPERATGMLTPTFGEETSRGFYVRDMGMYFVFGDYFDLSVTGDYYTLGSWALDVNSRYMVKYKFNGSFGLTYSHDQTGERDSPDFFESSNFGLKWSHSQDSKAKPGTSFSASVNFSSPSNSKYNSRSVNEALQNQISSSVSYSKNWGGKVNLSVSGLHSQNSRDSSYSFTLPNVSLSVSTFYPFKQKHRIGKEKAYEKISFGYSTSLQNKINFKASEFGQTDMLNKFQNGMNHNFSIGLPNFSLFKYINVNPSVSYGMNWFFRKTEYEYNRDTKELEEIKSKQFSTLGITQTYSGSVSMSTRLYGMFNFGKQHRLQAIRHVVSPTVSMSFSPDLAKSYNGWRDYEYTDANGVQQTKRYNIYQNQLNSVPSGSRSATANFSIGNNLEAKVRDLADTTGNGTKKVKLIDQLSISSSYNFLADSLNMNNIGISLSTTLFQKMNISGNLNFDPYAIDNTGKKINKYNIVQEGLAHPLRLTNASASVGYSISGKGEIKGNQGDNDPGVKGKDTGMGAQYRRVYYHPITGEYIPGGWLYYTNPSSPWSINFNYSFNYSKSYSYKNEKLNVLNKFTQTLGLSGNIKLTPKMSFNFTSGFDVMAMKITATQVSATYDLHCFNISVSWVPTGTWKSYSFTIAANSSTLADVLKFKKSNSYWDR